jgi:RHS repeat-associated protein
VRQTFTGHERDIETGLDYSDARYLATSLGRFTSPDPLLSSGRVEDPKSWNRYVYTLDNPLCFTDPTGLYVFDNNATDKQRDQFRASYQGLVTALGKLSVGSDEYNKVNSALTALGKENDPGVTVSFSPAANVKAGYEYKNDASGKHVASYTLTLTINADYQVKPEDLAHEGKHLSDFKIALEAGKKGIQNLPDDLNPTKFDREDRAYEVQQIVVRALGTDSGGETDTPIGGSNEFYLYQKSWEATDSKNPVVNRMKDARRQLLREDPIYHLTPDNPGPRIITKN